MKVNLSSTGYLLKHTHTLDIFAVCCFSKLFVHEPPSLKNLSKPTAIVYYMLFLRGKDEGKSIGISTE